MEMQMQTPRPKKKQQTKNQFEIMYLHVAYYAQAIR